MVFSRFTILSRVAWMRITASLTFGQQNICRQLNLLASCSEVFDHLQVSILLRLKINIFYVVTQIEDSFLSTSEKIWIQFITTQFVSDYCVRSLHSSFYLPLPLTTFLFTRQSSFHKTLFSLSRHKTYLNYNHMYPSIIWYPQVFATGVQRRAFIAKFPIAIEVVIEEEKLILKRKRK